MSSLTNILEARDFDVPPAPPQNLTGVCDRNPILQWDDNTEPDLDCYYVYEKVHISEWSLAGSTQNNHYNPESVFLCDPPAYNFSFYVRARDESSRLSNPSDTVSFMAFVKQIAEGQAEDYLSGMVPEAYALYPAHPNPFNPSTSIEYDLSEASRVSLVIYDIMGREVIRWEGLEEVGYRQVVWDGKDQGGRSVPAGIYLYRFTATSVESDKRFTASRKMVLLK
ncbi:MAG: FlgD immunoglobulin-like domain containing protein [Candidatus Neomarinimicrobiota bacterium]